MKDRDKAKPIQIEESKIRKASLTSQRMRVETKGNEDNATRMNDLVI